MEKNIEENIKDLLEHGIIKIYIIYEKKDNVYKACSITYATMKGKNISFMGGKYKNAENLIEDLDTTTQSYNYIPNGNNLNHFPLLIKECMSKENIKFIIKTLEKSGKEITPTEFARYSYCLYSTKEFKCDKVNQCLIGQSVATKLLPTDYINNMIGLKEVQERIRKYKETKPKITDEELEEMLNYDALGNVLNILKNQLKSSKKNRKL